MRAQGAEACPDGAVVAREVVTRLARDPFGPDPVQRIEAVVARDAERWLVRIYFRDARGALTGFREIESSAPGCEPITTAAALAIALGIDPDAPPPPPPPPPPVRRPGRRRARPAQLANAATPPRPRGLIRPHGGTLALRGFGILGVQPQFSGGGALAIDGSIWGPIRVSAGFFLPADVSGPDLFTDVGYSLFGAWVHACFEIWPVDRLALSGCVGATAGAFWAHAVMRTIIPEAPTLWAGPSADVHATIPLVGPLVAQIGISGVLSVAHREITARAQRPPFTSFVYDPGILAGLAYAGLGVQF